MLHCPWDMMRDGCNYFSFWAIFCTFTPLAAQKIKIKKKKKKRKMPGDISFYIWVPKIMIRWCKVSEICCVTDTNIFYFGPFFALLPPNSPKNNNFKITKQMPGDIITLHKWTKNYDQMMCGSWDMLRDRLTDRQMDG